MAQIGVSFERQVTVWNTECKVYVTRAANTVWRAHGTYMGESISAKGSSESSALAHWRDAARYRGG